MNIFIKPREIDGAPAVVRDPQTLAPLAAGGEWKTRSTYWDARLRDGDVIETAPPNAESGGGGDAQVVQDRTVRKTK